MTNLDALETLILLALDANHEHMVEMSDGGNLIIDDMKLVERAQ